jgi:phosphomannomutase
MTKQMAAISIRSGLVSNFGHLDLIRISSFGISTSPSFRIIPHAPEHFPLPLKAMIEKLFKAYDVRAIYPNPLNEDAAWKIGHATAQYLKRSRQGSTQRVKLEDTIVVGRDMRPSSPTLAKALIDGISSVGMNVIDVGMIDTSFMYFAINYLDAVGGIQTTASHNPAQYNGFKISGPKATPIGAASGLDDIKRIASSLRVGQTGVAGKIEPRDLWEPYRKHVLQFLDLKRPIKVVVDGSNGMAGKMVPAVFDGVPNLQIIPLLFEITGAFEHDPNPLVEQNLSLLKKRIASDKPDLGVCFDGDADRCTFVDENQATIGCDIITALLARDFLLVPRNKGSAIVYDLRSSHVVADEVKAAGGVPRRDRVGHAFIKKTLAETKAVFGGELSGHFYFRDNFYADSGAIAFARVLSVLSAQPKTLSELVAPLHRYSQTGEVNFQVEDKDAKIRALADAYKTGQVDYLDGITVDFGDWWFNVRKSNTEPLLRLNLEAKSKPLMEQKFAEMKKILGEPVHGH